MNPASVQADPGLLLATLPMVAVHAHTLRVVPPIRVLTVHNLSLILFDRMVRPVHSYDLRN